MKVEQIPRVLNWGSAPFSVSFRSSKPIVHTNGLELEVTLSEDLVFVETLRIMDGVTEHKFMCEDTVGDWRSVRVHAFQDCVNKAGKTLPLKRLIIFGASHLSIQQGILERFPEALDAINPVADVESDATRYGKPRRSNGRTITWGDQKEQVVEGPCEGHKYGGWGLNAYFIIPNREQLREMNMSMADRQLDSEDLEDYSYIEGDVVEDFVNNHFSIFTDDQDEDDKTIYPDEDATPVEEEEEEVTDPDSPDSDQTMIPQSDSDEEFPVESDASSRKRVKLEPQDETNCACCKDVELGERATTQKSMPNSCRPVEDELRESDFWLLENIG